MRLYEVRIHFYIHFTIAGEHARCPTISGNGGVALGTGRMPQLLTLIILIGACDRLGATTVVAWR